jgi:hypothetical protein
MPAYKKKLEKSVPNFDRSGNTTSIVNKILPPTPYLF